MNTPANHESKLTVQYLHLILPSFVDITILETRLLKRKKKIKSEAPSYGPPTPLLNLWKARGVAVMDCCYPTHLSYPWRSMALVRYWMPSAPQVIQCRACCSAEVSPRTLCTFSFTRMLPVRKHAAANVADCGFSSTPQMKYNMSIPLTKWPVFLRYYRY